MERIDWLHANFDSPVLIEEYVEGREIYVGVLGNDNPAALPVVELDLSKLPEGTPRIAGAEVKWGKGTARLPRHEVRRRRGPAEETVDAAAVRPPWRSFRRSSCATTRASTCGCGRRPGRRHRGQSEPVAGVEGRVRDGGAEVRAQLHAADRGDRRSGDGAVRRKLPIPSSQFPVPSFQFVAPS